MANKNKTGFIAAVIVFLITGTGFSEAVENEEFDLKPLRNPFWPVGYFPENWETMNMSQQDSSAIADQGWAVPAKEISVSGTSRMGDKTVAIINGEIKEVGELVEVLYQGRTYQWRVQKINADDGKVDLERVGIKNKGGAFHLGDKK